MTAIVYKIVPETLWHEARQTGVFHGASIDLKDGYIHFSTGPQAKETARLHFAGVTGLLLVAVDADALGEALRFEASRGGDLFPHLRPIVEPPRVLNPRRPRGDHAEAAEPAVVGVDVQGGFGGGGLSGEERGVRTEGG